MNNRTMPQLDARSRALHELVAAKIRNDPALFEKVGATLAHWRKIVAANSQPYLTEWQRLVDQGVDVCLAVATEDSQRADALRKSSPFVGILTEEERQHFLRTWKWEDDTP